MPEINLFAICVNAFIAVMGLLALLAGFLRLLLVVFPARELEHAQGKAPSPAADHAVTVAIQTAVGKMYPGARVSRIEPVD